MISPFSLSRLPRVEFGAGALRKLPDIAMSFGKRLLLVTGRSSFDAMQESAWLLSELARRGCVVHRLRVAGEPGTSWIDDAVASVKNEPIDAVLGIGGGSALDAAKAVAGLLKDGHSVLEYLEGVGRERPYLGPETPFIAVPTTAGTGTEATKNAVLTHPGRYKKSFRDERLVAAWAVVDPDLLASCPPALIAADGMDAFTQLLEAFVSHRANPMTDALARAGIMAVKDALLDLYREQSGPAREKMSWAALASGICLAQAGLGAVHGLASPLGAFFPIPHGVVCGTLVAEVTAANIAALQARAPYSPALPKYGEIGRRFARQKGLNGDEARGFLLDTLRNWQAALDLPRLGAYGIGEGDLPRIVTNARGASMQSNPVLLGDEELTRVLRARL